MNRPFLTPAEREPLRPRSDRPHATSSWPRITVAQPLRKTALPWRIIQEAKKRGGNEGFNVATGKYEDLVKAGVVDPTKVTRTALQNRFDLRSHAHHRSIGD